MTRLDHLDDIDQDPIGVTGDEVPLPPVFRLDLFQDRQTGVTNPCVFEIDVSNFEIQDQTLDRPPSNVSWKSK